MKTSMQISGQKFGRLTVIKKVYNPTKNSYWECLCVCGNKIITMGGNLRRNLTTSCGCFNREVASIRAFKHGLTNTSEYRIWSAMKRRCSNKNVIEYKNYGGRGIKVCEEWQKDFTIFLKDMGKRPEGKTLDRINNDGNYEPNNCAWRTWIEQANNRRKQKTK